MAITLISDLWTPAIWIRGINEKMNQLTALVNSGIMVKSNEFDGLATGGGTSVNLPFFKDITDGVDEIQVENTAPSYLGITSGIQVAPVLNRVSTIGASALAAAVAGEDPIGFATGMIATRRLKQRQTTLIKILQGIFAAGSGAANASGAVSAMKSDVFIETGNSATSANLIDGTKFNNTLALLGELSDDLINRGVILMHPQVRAALASADENSFERKSVGPAVIETYKGIPLVVNKNLVRAGTTNGYVYETYIISGGTIAYGEKAQLGDSIDAASLQFELDRAKNNGTIYDRTRFLMLPAGCKWVGTPSGQSATNTELGTAANWNLVYQSADRCGMALIRTNG